MSLQEFKVLFELGILWQGKVWIQNDAEARTEILQKVNEQLNNFSPDTRVWVKVGFQKYDPHVNVSGLKGGKYSDLCGWAANQKDGGASAAKQVLSWFSDTNLKDLPPSLAALVVIVSFAEVARGYKVSLEQQFGVWMNSIASADKTTAKALWLAYNDYFPPSLTYGADMSLEFA